MTVSNQRDRIFKLEATILRMNSLVESLGDQMARADALALQPHLVSTLHNAVAACASLAKEANQSKLEGRPLSSSSRRHHESTPFLQENRGVLLSPTSPLQDTPPSFQNPSRSLRSLVSLQPSPGSDTSSRPPSSTTPPLELSTFISQLQLACAYNAFQTLSDPTVTLDSVRNKFRFLLSLMSREHLTSYYKASLQARLDPSVLNPWEAVPFFGLGGAGSHYARTVSPIPRERGGADGQTQHDWPLISDPLLDFSAQIRENLDDTWFDARDLEGYLKENKVCLVIHLPSMSQHNDLSKYIDVVKLSQGM